MNPSDAASDFGDRDGTSEPGVVRRDDGLG